VPRIGIQEVIPGRTSLLVRWDVALDQNRVGYALYQATVPFDFAVDPRLVSATRLVLTAQVGQGYTQGVGANVYPFQQEISGLQPGTTHWLCLRAFDSLGNEELNQVVRSVTTFPGQVTMTIDGDFADWQQIPVALTDPADVADSAGPDWREIKLANDGQFLYVRCTSRNAFNLDGSPAFGYSRTLVFIDADQDPATGYVFGSLGSDLLIAGDSLYRQSAGTFNDGLLQVLAVAPKTSITEWELAIPLSYIEALQPNAQKVRLQFLNDEVFDLAPDATYLEYEIAR
jgi:hypothetical protein